jgi:hypothetical protein
MRDFHISLRSSCDPSNFMYIYMHGDRLGCVDPLLFNMIHVTGVDDRGDTLSVFLSVSSFGSRSNHVSIIIVDIKS